MKFMFLIACFAGFIAIPASAQPLDSLEIIEASYFNHETIFTDGLAVHSGILESKMVSGSTTMTCWTVTTSSRVSLKGNPENLIQVGGWGGNDHYFTMCEVFHPRYLDYLTITLQVKDEEHRGEISPLRMRPINDYEGVASLALAMPIQHGREMPLPVKGQEYVFDLTTYLNPDTGNFRFVIFGDKPTAHDHYFSVFVKNPEKPIFNITP